MANFEGSVLAFLEAEHEITFSGWQLMALFGMVMAPSLDKRFLPLYADVIDHLGEKGLHEIGEKLAQPVMIPEALLQSLGDDGG